MDRLVRAADAVCRRHPDIQWFAQIGDGEYEPEGMAYERMLDANQFSKQLVSADVIVSHAGMGNVLAARQHQIPILILPREAKFDEHINDHQLSTARAFSDREGVIVLESEADLEKAVLQCKEMNQVEPVSDSKEALLRFIASVIRNE